jgi:hypothetical protein
MNASRMCTRLAFGNERGKLPWFIFFNIVSMETSEIIPMQVQGKFNDLEETYTAADVADAIIVFERAVQRLKHPACWHTIAGVLSAAFLLVDHTGHELHRPGSEDDLIRIDVPGPGPATGDGYDWVRITRMEEKTDKQTDQKRFAMRLESCPAPGNRTGESAHFFKTGASSTFMVERTGKTVTASYHGRNEVSNTDTVSVVDNLRNAVIGIAALVGVSELQWKALLKGFLQD